MAKSLSERIAARTAKQAASRNDQNRAAFLALRMDIKQALDDGWAIKKIWETLQDEGKINFSYQAFRKYTNSLILSTPLAELLPPSPAVASPPPKTTGKIDKASAQKTPATGFTFTANPKKEDLI